MPRPRRSAACTDAAPPPAAASNAPAAATAEAACIAAVETTTGASDASVISSEFFQANTQVMVRVPGADGAVVLPLSNTGVVADVHYTGSEGFL